MSTNSNSSAVATKAKGWLFAVGTPPVEDPIRLERFQDLTGSLSWAPENRSTALRSIYTALNDLAYAEVRYYFERRQHGKWLSTACRLVAWLTGAVGLLLPLIPPVWPTAPANFTSWGYIAFAIAGSALVANSIFGGTDGHRRFVSTQLDVERLLTLFRLDWQRLFMEYEANPTTERASALIARSTLFVEALHAALSSETALWGKQLAEAITDLEKRIQVVPPKIVETSV